MKRNDENTLCDTSQMLAANAAADATRNTHSTDIWDRGNACDILGN